MTKATLLLLCAFAAAGMACSASPGTQTAKGQTGDSANRADAGDRSDEDDALPDDVPPSTRDGSADGCNRVEIDFQPRTPNVFVLVDRSSSMFDQGFWEPLREGVLAVIERLDTTVSFGFTTYTGQEGGVCPDMSGVDTIALGNAEAISQAYRALGAPPYRGETPTGAAIAWVVERLAEAEIEGPNFILLVTDGEPDFCDNPNPTCSRDAVVAEVQRAHAAGIGTFIFSIGGGVNASHLHDVANAGTGQPVSDHDMAVKYQCGTPRATYDTSDGDAPYFEPDVTNQDSLVTQLGTVVAGVKSCVFDLAGQVQINLQQAADGVVEIDGVRLAYDDADGWRMNSATQLELTGAACERLKQPDTRSVLIDFPCEAVVVL
jgi:hypothetical protein